MKPDFSLILYNKYFNLSNRIIEITLKNGYKIKGEIIGFFLDDEDDREPHIVKWQIIKENDKILFDENTFVCSIGEIINQKDIAEVYFKEDSSIMKF